MGGRWLALGGLARHNAGHSTNLPRSTEPPPGGKAGGVPLAASDVLPKALTNPTWRLCWGSAASSVLVRNVYLVHKGLPPPETENRVVGVMGASKSAGDTSRDDFAPVASRERGSVSLPFVQ